MKKLGENITIRSDSPDKVVEELQRELRRLKRKPEGKIGIALLFLGLLLLLLAILYSHNVAAFIGIALTFWGALLFYIRPTRFIRKEILDSTTLEPNASTMRLIEELGYEGTPTYISPGTLRGLRTATIYIPKNDETQSPTDEQLSQDNTLIQSPPAIKITPPGLGLHRLLEEELRTNFSTADILYLQANLEKALVEGLEIVESCDIETEASEVKVTLRNSIFKETIDQLEEKGLKIGDPLSSAIACILARSTRKPTTIQSIQNQPDGKTIVIIYKVLGERPSASS